MPTSSPTTDGVLAREKILVSLSGGADSTALLLALAQLASTSNWEIFACHVNHNLRGEESNEDEEFCRTLCSDLNIELEVQQDQASIDCKSNETGTFEALNLSEESLRERRYCFLVEAAQKRQAKYILTAHTLDDQTETVLFRLIRGSALKGLSGISLVSDLAENIRLIRPLLSFTKDDCCHFLCESSTSFRCDSSNLNQKFARNYLRHTVIPLIEARFNNFSLHVEQLREIIEKEDVWLTQLTRQQITQLEELTGLFNVWPMAPFNSHPLALRRRMVAEALRQRKIEPSFKRIAEIIEKAEVYAKQILNEGQSTITLSSAWQIQFTSSAFLWANNQEPERGQININGQKLRNLIDMPFNPITVRIPGNNMVLSCSRVLKIEDLSCQSPAEEFFSFPRADACEALVDLSSVIFPLVLRLRAAGDMIQPLGMKEKVRLKKYLHTHKHLSGEARQPFAQQLSKARLFGKNAPTGAVVVLTDQEEVIWVPGIGLSEKVKVATSPTHRLKWLALAPDSTDIA